MASGPHGDGRPAGARYGPAAGRRVRDRGQSQLARRHGRADSGAAGDGPAVAAAADYWFRGGLRPWICRVLCGAFPVRRSGGGSADLAAAARLLAAGRDVIVYAEGTRSRDGEIGEFHRGAARLAAAACVPLVPVGITGTRMLLPPRGTAARLGRTAVGVRIGVPVGVSSDMTAEARARVAVLVTAADEPAVDDSALRDWRAVGSSWPAE